MKSVGMSRFLVSLRFEQAQFGDVFDGKTTTAEGTSQLLKWLLPRFEGDGKSQLMGAWTLHSSIESNRKDSNALNLSMVQHNALVPF